MSRIIIEATHIDPNVCFECGAPATERHHVVPASLGGTKTVPLCGICHAKIHDVDGNRRTRIAELTKAALDAKKLVGKLGCAIQTQAKLQQPQRWRKQKDGWSGYKIVQRLN